MFAQIAGVVGAASQQAAVLRRVGPLRGAGPGAAGAERRGAGRRARRVRAARPARARARRPAGLR